MRAKVVSVAIDPAAPQHGTLTGTGQWQLSIKTAAQVLYAHYCNTKIRSHSSFRAVLSCD